MSSHALYSTFFEMSIVVFHSCFIKNQCMVHGLNRRSCNVHTFFILTSETYLVERHAQWVHLEDNIIDSLAFGGTVLLICLVTIYERESKSMCFSYSLAPKGKLYQTSPSVLCKSRMRRQIQKHMRQTGEGKTRNAIKETHEMHV